MLDINARADPYPRLVEQRATQECRNPHSPEHAVFLGASLDVNSLARKLNLIRLPSDLSPLQDPSPKIQP